VKCFDTWKNDFAQARAWRVHRIAIENQARLALFTPLLVTLWRHEKTAAWGVGDGRRCTIRTSGEPNPPPNTSRRDGPQYPIVTAPKISRQVLRFRNTVFSKTLSCAV
jgi:hypothetical protein